MTETELAGQVIAWLRHEGWEVYQEVEGRNGRCDIYAVREPLTWAIEVKKTFGLRVIEQAHGWLGYANLVSLAVPSVTSSFGQHLCEHFGIGTIEMTERARDGWDLVDIGEKWPSGDTKLTWVQSESYNELKVIERSTPRLWRRCVRPTLYDSQKDFAPAGNNYGKYVTGASEAKRQLVQLVRHEPGIALNEALTRIKHHYASHASARSTIMKYIEWGDIPDLRIERDGRTVRLYPTTT